MINPLRVLSGEIADRLAKAPVQLNAYGYDPYGFHPPTARRLLLPAALYHSGQFAYDGFMLMRA